MSRTVVVMGVSGAGKSTVGPLVAHGLGVAFRDADDLHSASNRALMAAGTPLTDVQRLPWLRDVGTAMGGSPCVVACSALGRRHRDVLRSAVPTAAFIHLDASPVLLAERLGRRRGHFMPPGLLASQHDALEELGPDEHGARFHVGAAPEDIAGEVLGWLSVHGSVLASGGR